LDYRNVRIWINGTVSWCLNLFRFSYHLRKQIKGTIMKTKDIHKTIDLTDRDEVKQVAYDYLVALLHKIGISTAGELLSLNVPTLQRIVDPDLAVEQIKYITAAYIVFMYETNNTIAGVMDLPPRGTAYYKRSNGSK
jgi:hypothetical protein